MKKTLIALAVAASAVVSGSAMAWTVGGTGGSVELGGTLTPETVQSPWEVKTGAAVTGLDANVQQGQSVVDITVNSNIPVLGIRNADVNGLAGSTGITPAVDYQNALDLDNFTAGTSRINLSVTNDVGDEIGSMFVDFSSAAYASNNVSVSSLYASRAGTAFWGGLGKSPAGVVSTVDDVESVALSFFPDINDNKGNLDSHQKYDQKEFEFNAPNHTYYSVYASGIEQGKNIRITLNNPVQGDDAIIWKASLPVTVSYQ